MQANTICHLIYQGSMQASILDVYVTVGSSEPLH